LLYVFGTLGDVPILNSSSVKDKKATIKEVHHPRLSVFGLSTAVAFAWCMNMPDFNRSGFLSRIDVWFGADIERDKFRLLHDVPEVPSSLKNDLLNAFFE